MDGIVEGRKILGLAAADCWRNAGSKHRRRRNGAGQEEELLGGGVRSALLPGSAAVDFGFAGLFLSRRPLSRPSVLLLLPHSFRRLPIGHRHRQQQQQQQQPKASPISIIFKSGIHSFIHSFKTKAYNKSPGASSTALTELNCLFCRRRRRRSLFGCSASFCAFFFLPRAHWDTHSKQG
jgi:hypothetical protein